MSDLGKLADEYNRIQRTLENIERDLQELIDRYAQADHPPYPGDNVEPGLTGAYQLLIKSADGVLDRAARLKKLVSNAAS